MATQACINCPITLENRNFVANLMCLPLSHLDVILGIDRLSSNHIMLDYLEKSLIFPNSKDPRFLTANQVQASMKEGAQGYMLLSSLEVKEEFDLTEVSIVKEFPEVFLDDDPGLSLEREIEFSVDLLPGTGPISIVPYRMSSSELAELKK